VSTQVLYRKRNDTLPRIDAQFYSSTLQAGVDLTGATVRFHMLDSMGTLVIDASATAVDAANGFVKYDLQPGDTAVVGRYRCEFEADYGSGSKLTSATFTLAITEDLDDA